MSGLILMIWLRFWAVRVIADNFDFTHAAFKNLDEVLPRLFGEGSIGFKVADPGGTNGASERASEEPLEPPIYETLSEQLDDDLQPIAALS